MHSLRPSHQYNRTEHPPTNNHFNVVLTCVKFIEVDDMWFTLPQIMVIGHWIIGRSLCALLHQIGSAGVVHNQLLGKYSLWMIYLLQSVWFHRGNHSTHFMLAGLVRLISDNFDGFLIIVLNTLWRTWSKLNVWNRDIWYSHAMSIYKMLHPQEEANVLSCVSITSRPLNPSGPFRYSIIWILSYDFYLFQCNTIIILSWSQCVAFRQVDRNTTNHCCCSRLICSRGVRSIDGVCSSMSWCCSSC